MAITVYIGVLQFTHKLMNKKKTTLLAVDGVSDVMAEGNGT